MQGGGFSSRYGDGEAELEQAKLWLRKRLERAARFVQVGVVAAIVIWLATGIYVVSPDELGVVRRFGADVGRLNPGPHLRLPRPIERVDLVKVTQIRSLELGFRRVTKGQQQVIERQPEESHMITGDENIVDLQLVIQYRIADPGAYLFNVADPEGGPDARTLRDATEASIRLIGGKRPIDDVLTEGRFQVQAETREQLQALLDSYRSGLLVTEVRLQAVEPPEPVKDAFRDVVSAKEDREKVINQAQAYREDLLPKARGEAQQIVRAAEAYRETRVRDARGQAERFLSVLKEYSKAKDVTRARMYLETMEEVLPGVTKYIVSNQGNDNLLKFLPLEERRR